MNERPVVLARTQPLKATTLSAKPPKATGDR